MRGQACGQRAALTDSWLTSNRLAAPDAYPDTVARVHADSMILADGRKLGWAEIGAPDGAATLLHNHGTPSSRLELAGFSDVFREFGVRVIAPDRPGYGTSSPRRSGRSVNDWADDVAQLAVHLRLDRFAVSGYSGGAPHALAIAAALTTQVTHILLIAGVQEGVACPGEDDLWILAHANDYASFEEAFPSEGLPELAASDLAALSDHVFGPAMIATLVEGSAQGHVGGAGDEYAFAYPWGVDHAAVTQPVEMWHGDADTIVPHDHLGLLAKTYPQAVAHTLAGHGHISILTHLPTMLGLLFGQGERQPS